MLPQHVHLCAKPAAQAVTRAPRAAAWGKHTAHARLPCYLGILEPGGGSAVTFFPRLERRSSPWKQDIVVTRFMDIFRSFSLMDCAIGQQKWARGLEGSLESRERSWHPNVNVAALQCFMGRVWPALKLCWILTVPNSFPWLHSSSGDPCVSYISFLFSPTLDLMGRNRCSACKL